MVHSEEISLKVNLGGRMTVAVNNLENGVVLQALNRPPIATPLTKIKSDIALLHQ